MTSPKTTLPAWPPKYSGSCRLSTSAATSSENPGAYSAFLVATPGMPRGWLDPVGDTSPRLHTTCRLLGSTVGLLASRSRLLQAIAVLHPSLLRLRRTCDLRLVAACVAPPDHELGRSRAGVFEDAPVTSGELALGPIGALATTEIEGGLCRPLRRSVLRRPRRRGGRIRTRAACLRASRFLHYRRTPAARWYR